MIDKPDYILDISGADLEPLPGNEPVREIEISPSKARNRKYLNVLFECCGVYQYIYRNAAGTAYVGRCPKCLRPVRVLIGPGGTDNRFFRAT